MDAMAYAAPLPSALNGETQTSLKLASSIPRSPQPHHVIASVPPTYMSSSAPPYTTPPINTPNSLYASRNFSNASSPFGTPLQAAADGIPGAMHPISLAAPGPLDLGESMMAVSASAGVANIGDSTLSSAKAPGLIRRISRGAANRLSRRRQSGAQPDKRDRSSGPVIMRRRSDSKTSAQPTTKETALVSSNEDEAHEALDTMAALGSADGPVPYREIDQPPREETGAIAPKVDSIIQRGTVLTKVTKKRLKQLRFFLDLNAAKVFWDVSNPSKRFYIDDVREIRVGADARNYREEHQVPEDAESRWFTIVLSDLERSKERPVKTLHLIAPDLHILGLWTTTLENISRYRIGLMAGMAGSGQSEAVLKAHWHREMARLHPNWLEPGESETLDFAAVESVCRSLHINYSKNMLRAQFSKADPGKQGRLTFHGFKDFVARLKERKDVKEIFKSRASDVHRGLYLDEFLGFLHDVQGEDVAAHREYWVSVFDKFVRRCKARTPSSPGITDGQQPPRMGLDAFSSYLASANNGVYASRPPESTFDRPMNEYFISSSHNTYLLGRQVAGASSTEAYVSALQQGCRCVEIDCWDGADGRPIVSHGRTLTTSVLFADCITVINRYAFISTDFPLILSLEVHCNAEQQLAMVKIMKDTFKEQLVLEPLLTNCHILPSPEELKGRILVKVKTCDEEEIVMSTDPLSPSPPPPLPPAGRKRSSSSPFTRPMAADNSLLLNLPPLSSPPSIGHPDSTVAPYCQERRSFTAPSISSATEDSDGALIAAPKEKRRRQKSKITKPLSDLGVYTRGYKWHSFSSPESKRYNHVYSFAERAFESICRDSDGKAQLEVHNRRFLTRVYPSGFRVKSSNFDPNKFWRRGVQMVALNWQTYDVGMQMNQAMFAAGTDRTGYVLKPESLRATTPFDSERRRKMDRKLVRFTVEVISAQQLPRPRSMGPDDNINPYVEIEMFSADDRGQSFAFGEGGMDASDRNGMSGIGCPHRRRTKIEQSNGYSPTFNDRFKLSLETKYPDLVFVRWTVRSSLDGRSAGNSNSVQLATFTAKLTSLSQGYRYLPLYDASGDQYLFSTLFCRITKEKPVSVQRLDLEELRAERMGIFRQIGQTVFKRASSAERERERERDRDRQLERGSETPNSLDEKDSSPSLTPSISAASTSSFPSY